MSFTSPFYFLSNLGITNKKMRPSKIKCYFNIVDHHKVGPHKEYRYFSFLESKELWTKIKV